MKVSRRYFLKYCAGSAAALGLEFAALGTLEKVLASEACPPVASYPIAFDVFTTLQNTVVPDPPSSSEKILADEISKYKQSGYSIWHRGPGIDSVRGLDLMSLVYSGASAVNTARLLKFFTISDVHITGKESPAQAIYLGLKDGISSAYLPVMLYATHILNAAVQTINSLHKQDPIDFGMALGDACNSTQCNELR